LPPGHKSCEQFEQAADRSRKLQLACEHRIPWRCSRHGNAEVCDQIESGSGILSAEQYQSSSGSLQCELHLWRQDLSQSGSFQYRGSNTKWYQNDRDSRGSGKHTIVGRVGLTGQSWVERADGREPAAGHTGRMGFTVNKKSVESRCVTLLSLLLSIRVM
jgi:hypothetical protein